MVVFDSGVLSEIAWRAWEWRFGHSFTHPRGTVWGVTETSGGVWRHERQTPRVIQVTHNTPMG